MQKSIVQRISVVDLKYERKDGNLEKLQAVVSVTAC